MEPQFLFNRMFRSRIGIHKQNVIHLRFSKFPLVPLQKTFIALA